MAKDIQFPEMSEARVLTVHVVFAAHPVDEPKSSVFVSGKFSFKEKEAAQAYYLRAVHEAFAGWPVTIRDLGSMIYIEGPIIDADAERACQHFMAYIDRDVALPR